jgi:hypothetical protein
VLLSLLADMLTVGGVKLLVECSYPATDEYYNFQAIDVSDEYHKSRRTLVATLSNGVSYLKCFVSPQVHHVFDEKGFSKNSTSKLVDLFVLMPLLAFRLFYWMSLFSPVNVF